MNHNDQLARWALFCRRAAMVGVGLGLALCFAWFQSALGQDKGKTAAKPPATKLLSAEESDQHAAAALAQSEPDRKDAHQAGNLIQEKFDLIQIVWNEGGHMWALYAILVLSLVALTFALERFLGLRRSRVAPTDLLAGIRALAGRKGDLDLRQAQRLAKQYPSSAAVVFRAMLAKAGRPSADVERALSEACEREGSRLYSNVRWQGLTFNLAPMLGLAGTVYGVIIAFFQTAHMAPGANKTESLATGIYAALICTLAGLIVAIPAGVLAHYFEGRIMRLLRNVDDAARSILPQLERLEGRVRPRPAAEKGAAESPALDLAPPES
ncbi:MAG: MotA/TolQ/ExbB proton channel family protein [Thermoguttaceae bacterium]